MAVWVRTSLDPAAGSAFAWKPGIVLETYLYDDEGRRLGNGIMCVIEVKEVKGETFFMSDLFCVQDDSYAWWMKNDGHANPGWYHRCEGQEPHCCEVKGLRKPLVHLDTFRKVTWEQLGDGVIEWCKRPFYQRAIKEARKRHEDGGGQKEGSLEGIETDGPDDAAHPRAFDSGQGPRTGEHDFQRQLQGLREELEGGTRARRGDSGEVGGDAGKPRTAGRTTDGSWEPRAAGQDPFGERVRARASAGRPPGGGCAGSVGSRGRANECDEREVGGRRRSVERGRSRSRKRRRRSRSARRRRSDRSVSRSVSMESRPDFHDASPSDGSGSRAALVTGA